jgi:CubicO group peptidase (beta-lactamase class C family)
MTRTARFVVMIALFSSCALQLHAQSKTSAASAPKQGDQDARIRRVETMVVDLPMGENQAPLRMDLLQLMKLYNVPGLSIAVIDDYKMVWAKGYGVIETGSSTPVTAKTLFQAGSISKPVAATGALNLVEHGKLVLYENVNEKLKTWKVPENDLTKNEKVTLRRLMSHTAGLTVHGFPGYDTNETVPTLVQIFNGEKPANTAPVRVDILPGTKEVYSGGGVTIEQQLMIDVTGKAFPALMRELVLDKLGMADSSYEQPLPPARAAMTASGTYADGKVVHGRWHVYPEMAAAGLWTTPTDLSKFAIETALSKHGKANHVLSEKMTNEMLKPVLEAAGLGLFMDKNNPGQFGHNGADEGFQAILTMNAESGKGVAIMANSDNGIAVGDILLRSVAKEYGWNYKSAEPGTIPMLVLIAKARGTQAALQRYSELNKSPSAEYKVEEQTLNRLGYTLLFSGQVQDAITVFQRNVREYPESGNVYDSLGEAYMKAGQKELAIQNYEKSLKLDSKNENAVEMLKKLKEMK